MFADSWFGLYKSLYWQCTLTLTKKLKSLPLTLFSHSKRRGLWTESKTGEGHSEIIVGLCWEVKGAKLFSYSWFMLSCLILSLEIDCINKVEPLWVLGKHPAVVESRFRFTLPERKVKAGCMKLTQTGIGAGLGIKSEPKLSETILSFFSSVPLWELLKYYKASFSQWTEILFTGIDLFF